MLQSRKNEIVVAWLYQIVRTTLAEPYRASAVRGVKRRMPASKRCRRSRLAKKVEADSTLRRTIDACEVGRAAVLLASDYTTAITGEVLFGDAGFHIEGMVFH